MGYVALLPTYVHPANTSIWELRSHTLFLWIVLGLELDTRLFSGQYHTPFVYPVGYTDVAICVLRQLYLPSFCYVKRRLINVRKTGTHV